MFKPGDKVHRLPEYCEDKFDPDEVYTVALFIADSGCIELDDMDGRWDIKRFRLASPAIRPKPGWF